MNNLLFIIGLLFINIILFIIMTKLFTKLKIYDEPDFSRKIHTSNVPLVGGIIFLINLSLYLFVKSFIEISPYFSGFRELFAFLFGSFFIFLIGLYDDKYSLKPNTKLILLSIIVASSISISTSFQINYVSFLFNEKIIFLETFGIVFTIFCFLVFLNAFNMIDGINGLSASYFLICLIYLIILNFNFHFFLFLFIPAIIFLYFNFRNKAFLGDGGSLLLGFILSCLFIKSHNESLIFADQIVLLMLVPGIDMLRVAIIRLLKKKHPFKADQSHLHHLILKKYTPKISYYSIIFIIGISALLSKFIENKFINIIQIIIILFLYFSYINFRRSK